jgi:chorismate-pyruvate lyase
MLQSYYDKRGPGGENLAFRSKGFVAPDWSLSGIDRKGITMASLPPFLRTLLVTDGTVTKSLEAYYWEPVRVDNVSNTVVTSESEIDWLDVRNGEEVIARGVQLRGGMSRTLYASAFSIIRMALIPEALRTRLLAGQLGIGELIRECGLETYRELLEFGYTTDMSRFGGPETNLECVYRTYRIILDHRPAILVSECFPVAVFNGARPQL